MRDDRPYALKYARAMKHLDEVKDELRLYEGRHPYIPSRDREANPNPRVWIYRARLAEQPSPNLALALGDFAHNLRSSLNHLVACLKTQNSKSKRQAKFIPVREDIWATDPKTSKYIAGTDSERKSWAKAVEGIDPDALTLLEASLPYTQPLQERDVHPFAVLNALDNADKYYEIATIALGIKDPITTLRAGGFVLTDKRTGITHDGEVVAEFRIYPGELKTPPIDQTLVDRIIDTLASGAEVQVDITGEPQIALWLPSLKGNAPLPDALDNLASLTRQVLTSLDLFVEVREASGS